MHVDEKIMTNSRNLNALENSVLVLVLLGLAITVGLYLSSVSFDWGLVVGKASVSASDSDSGTKTDEFFGQPTERTYEYLGRRYSYAAGFLLSFLAGWVLLTYYKKYFQTSLNADVGFRLALLIFILLAIYQYWWIIAEKSLRSAEMYWDGPLDGLARSAYPIDWACSLILAASMIAAILLHALHILDHRVLIHQSRE